MMVDIFDFDCMILDIFAWLSWWTCGLIDSSCSIKVSLDGMNGMGMISVALSICNTGVVNSRGSLVRQVLCLSQHISRDDGGRGQEFSEFRIRPRQNPLLSLRHH